MRHVLLGTITTILLTFLLTTVMQPETQHDMLDKDKLDIKEHGDFIINKNIRERIEQLLKAHNNIPEVQTESFSSQD